jgi:hypothetical protein
VKGLTFFNRQVRVMDKLVEFTRTNDINQNFISLAEGKFVVNAAHVVSAFLKYSKPMEENVIVLEFVTGFCRIFPACEPDYKILVKFFNLSERVDCGSSDSRVSA